MGHLEAVAAIALVHGLITQRSDLSHDRRVRRYLAQPWFQRIDTKYPGLRLINAEPYIFAVNNFLSQSECDALIAKVEAGLPRQQGMGDFSEEASDRRTSFGAVATNQELPSLRARMARLVQVDEDQMQPTKLSKYTAGQEFTAHVDAVHAVYDDRCDIVESDDLLDLYGDGNRQVHGYGAGVSFPGMNRHVTVLIYLNDCAKGGRTRWDWTRTVPGWHAQPFIVGSIHLDEQTPFWRRKRVQPQRGMAVVHFPSTTLATGGLTDPNARHAGEPAVDTKYVAQTFIWNRAPPAELGFEFLEDENLPIGRLDKTTL